MKSDRSRGEAHPQAKLTEAIVRKLRRMHHDGFCIGCISRTQDIPRQTVWDAVSYLTWRHVRD